MKIQLTQEEKELDIENALKETENGLQELVSLGCDINTVPEALWIRTILKRAIYAENALKKVE